MTEPLEQPGSNWTEREVDLAVNTYFEVWRMSLGGSVPNKTRFYRAFDKATGRGRKSIERKCQNISAILERLGLPWLPSLAPLRNYQKALIAAVEVHVQKFWHLDDAISVVTPLQGISDAFVLFPEETPPLEPPVTSSNPDMERLARKFDPALRDLRNRKTGQRGEEIVYYSERARLSAAGRPDLANKVKWVSQEDGDGAGYDVLSFETDGTERFFEVKTTIGPKRTPFFLSRNERDFPEEAPSNFRIFRLYELGKTPRSFLIAPPLNSALILEPSVYRASFG